ncbi:MAG: hypothetical protein II951_05085 [Bacteroidales bacterium]|nr:hypothetical protein [Bacteroidales bacterium]
MMSVIAGVVASVIGAMVSAYLTQRAKREEEGSAKLIVKSAELESNRERTRVEVMNVGSADAEEVKVEIVGEGTEFTADDRDLPFGAQDEPMPTIKVRDLGTIVAKMGQSCMSIRGVDKTIKIRISWSDKNGRHTEDRTLTLSNTI